LFQHFIATGKLVLVNGGFGCIALIYQMGMQSLSIGLGNPVFCSKSLKVLLSAAAAARKGCFAGLLLLLNKQVVLLVFLSIEHVLPKLGN
jgi:hypothetical protein